ncbi:hypothetical protein Dsin_000324 [Dipteronia sinensis]|uniref:DUF1985 domain-containing protein n=1 Tax=Dipteronia sinensis TaxID=43782 RepID=A0AAE0EHB2_9ROSI|nr:hypothetical protein Dsin_000324 [Dipteronia sinensis]
MGLKSDKDHKYFGGRDLVRFTKLQARIQQGKWQEQFDAVKLCLMLMVNCVLTGLDERDFILIWQLSLVNDLDAFNAFSWGSYVYKYSIFGFKKAEQSRPPRYNVYEFVYALLVFAFEVIFTLAMQFATLREAEGFPHVRRSRTDRQRSGEGIMVLPGDRREHVRGGTRGHTYRSVREEKVCSSDRNRHEQHQELVRMIRALYGTSIEMHSDEPFDFDATWVTAQMRADNQQDCTVASDIIPQQDTAAVSHSETAHQDTTALSNSTLQDPTAGPEGAVESQHVPSASDTASLKPVPTISYTTLQDPVSTDTPRVQQVPVSVIVSSDTTVMYNGDSGNGDSAGSRLPIAD